MLDHLFLTVNEIDRSIAFYERVLSILGFTNRHDYDGKDGPAGHPDLKGFGAKGRMFFWLKQGTAAPGAVHVGFVADSEEMVNLAHAEALAAGATENHPPGAHFTMTRFTTRRRSRTSTATPSNSSTTAGNTEVER